MPLYCLETFKTALLWTECYVLHLFIYWSPKPQCDGTEGGTFWEVISFWLGHEHEAFMMELETRLEEQEERVSL